MAVDSFSHSSEDVLKDLDPLSRALLDLSVHRGMEDAEIAEILGTDEQAVSEVRVGLLRSLAEKVAPEHADADVPELQAVIADRLYGENAAATEPEGAPPEPEALEPEPEPAADDARTSSLYALPDPHDDHPAAVRAPEPRKRRSPLVVLLPLLLIAAVAGVILLTSGGGSSSDSDERADTPATSVPPAGEPAEKPAAREPAPEEKPRAVRLNSLGAGDARGTALRDGNRLKLKLRGLPALPAGGAYEIWLYDSVIDAKSLGASKDAKIDLDAKLPPDASDYEYVDVSVEPGDGNANHSGQSVLRVPLEKLDKR